MCVSRNEVPSSSINGLESQFESCMEIIGRPFYRCTVGCVEGVRLYKVVQLYIYTPFNTSCINIIISAVNKLSSRSPPVTCGYKNYSV